MSERIDQQKEDLANKSKDYLDNDSKSELSNTFGAMSANKKKIKSEKVLYFLEKVQPRLENAGLTVREFNTNSFRITDGITIVDYYPSSSKMINLGKTTIVVKDVFLTILSKISKKMRSNS